MNKYDANYPKPNNISSAQTHKLENHNTDSVKAVQQYNKDLSGNSKRTLDPTKINP